MSNLLSLLSCVTGKSIDSLVPEYEDKMYGHLKGDVAEAVVELLTPIQERFHQYREDQAFLDKVMKEGAEKASAHAQNVLKKVYDAIGFVAKP